MKRKLLTYGLLAVFIGAVVWACQRDRFGHEDPNAVEPTLTVNEARDFFEYQFSEMMPYLTKLPQYRPVGMMPGDFTPLWDKARIGANPEMDGADVPIDPKFIFVAVFNKITPEGDTLRQTVDVTQKLVVKKWRNTDEYEAFCYIASIVPTPEYHARHKNIAKEFRYAGSKGDFSGFVIYRTLTGRLVGVDNYENGQRTRHDYFPQVTDRNEDSVYTVARATVGDIQVQAGTAAAFSKDMEEDDPCRIYIADPVLCSAERPHHYCPVCGYEYCICGKDDWPENWGDHSGSGGDQGGGNPDYNDGGNTGTGNEGSTGNTDNSSEKELMNKSKFVGYLTSGDCMQGCIRILANYGIRTYSTSTIIMATEGKNGQLNIYRESYIDGVNAINRHINAGRPVIVGISRGWGIGVGNSNPATDHFVVITGRGIDYNTGYYYYTYMETGTSNVDQGCDINDNRLYLNPDIPVLEDASGMNGDKYRVTEVRANDGN